MLCMQKNFKYLDDLIHSGQKDIVLDSDIVLDDGEESEYLKGIKLDVDNLAIEGNGYTIDAQRLTRIFYCTGKNVTIKNITLKRGFSKGNGGAVHNKGGLTIIKSKFIDCTAKRGGTLYNIDKLTIRESAFDKNIANRDGGSIYNKGRISITKSSFNKNSAKWGGAIHNKSELSIIKSKLIDNFAKCGGGAIHNKGELVINETAFSKNIAKVIGGVINNNSRGELIIRKSILTENTSEDTGGVIHSSKGNFKIFNCEISCNNSPNNIITNKDSLQIYETVFNRNQSKHIISNSTEMSNLSVFYGVFIENNVVKSVITNSGKFCSVEKTIFESNLSHKNSKNIINLSDLTLISPKIIDVEKSILNKGDILIRDSSPDFKSKIGGDGNVEVSGFLLNNQKFDFGYLDRIIHESDRKEITLKEDICFEKYERDYYEGGIELDIDDLVIDGKGHTIDGADKTRIFLITGCNVTLKNIIFKNGRSHKNYDNPQNSNGGAIKINYKNKLTIDNCKFLRNTSEKYGGAIHNNGEITITKSIISKNTVNSKGGAIHNIGNLNIIESIINENISGRDGGAIYNYGEKLNIIESTINENIIKEGNGGAIFNYGGELDIIKSVLTENIANREGGAIYGSNSELNIYKSEFNNNIANYGGAIHNNGKMDIMQSTFSQNASNGKYGGAIHNYGGELNIIESLLIGNTAERYGGAIYLRMPKYGSKNCTFKENKPDDVFEEK